MDDIDDGLEDELFNTEDVRPPPPHTHTPPTYNF
jgi:hypothetical protein